MNLFFVHFSQIKASDLILVTKENINDLAFLAGHTAIGAGMISMGGVPAVAGTAYLGATAINTFRRGNNIGPM